MILSDFTKVLIIIIFFTICLSLRFFYMLESDYGIYFSGSYYFFNSDLTFYETVKDFKPPGYYLFLGLIGSFFDWSYFSAYIGYICSIFLFVSSSALIFLKINKNLNHFITYIIITSTFMSFLSTNAAIALFQCSLINICLFFHTRIYNKESSEILNIFLSYMFVSFAILSRVDSIIIIPIFLLATLFFYKDTNIVKIIKYFFIALIGFLIPFLLLTLLEISLSDFLFYNFELAAFYKENYISKVQYLYKPKVIEAVSGSALLFLIPIIFYNAYSVAKTNKNFSHFFAIVGLLFTFLVYFWIGTDRVYHLLIIFPFLSMVFAIALQNIKKCYSFTVMATSLMVLVVFFQNLVPNLYATYQKRNDIFNIPIEINELEKFMSHNNIQHIVSGDIKPWFHVLKKDSNPKLSYFHNLFVFFDFRDSMLTNDFNKLLNTEETKFLIDIGLFDSSISTPIMKEIRAKSYTVGEYGDYYIQVILTKPQYIN